VVVSAVLVLVTAAVSVRRPWVGDFGLHAGTVEQLKARLWHPLDPMVGVPARSPYFTPYTVMLGLLARIFGLAGSTVLAIAAPAGVALVAIGLHRFVRTLSAARWAPLLALAAVLLVWGTFPLAWSGFLSLFGLPLMGAYPSTVATGLTLLWFSGIARHVASDTEPETLRAAGYGLGGAVIALIHPFSGVIAMIGAAALLARPLVRSGGRARLPAIAVALAVAVVVAIATLAVWPYYSFFALARAGGLDAVHRPLYEHMLTQFGLAIVTLPALWLRWRRDRLDPLVLFAVACALGVAAGAGTGHYALVRLLPGALLAGQIGLGIEIARALSSGRERVSDRLRTAPLTAAALAIVAVVAMVGAWRQAGNLLLGLPPAVASRFPFWIQQADPDLAWVRAHAEAGDVVVTDRSEFARVLPAYGLFTVAPAWPDPAVPDSPQRSADQAILLDPATGPATVAELLARYRVRWLLLPAGSVGPPGPWPATLVDRDTAGDELFRVDPRSASK
jgi:alpha-1,6-mannosyltransferase